MCRPIKCKLVSKNQLKCRKVFLMYSPLVPEGPEFPYCLRYMCRRWEEVDTWIHLSVTQQETRQEKMMWIHKADWRTQHVCHVWWLVTDHCKIMNYCQNTSCLFTLNKSLPLNQKLTKNHFKSKNTVSHQIIDKKQNIVFQGFLLSTDNELNL